MRKLKQKQRLYCVFCGARRFQHLFDPVKVGGLDKFMCKNNDWCQLKMSYNKTHKI